MGNSTHWIVLEGVAILTDPWVSEPADCILSHRYEPRPLPTRPDVVLITHEHGDHFDLAALRLLDRGAAVVVPEGEMAEGVARPRVRARCTACAPATCCPTCAA